MKAFLAILVGLLLFSNVYALTPGGLVTHTNVGTDPATSMSVTITINKEPLSHLEYFWAQQFALNATVDHGGYFGLQATGIMNGQNVGKMLIFSIWNATEAIPNDGASFEAFGNEGSGFSIRKQYDWQEGVPYTFTLNKDGFWWQLSVSSPEFFYTNLGKIKVTEDVLLSNKFIGFTEQYGDVATCADLPYVQATFSNFKLDGTKIPAVAGQPYGNCAASAKIAIVNDVAVHTIGTAPPKTNTVSYTIQPVPFLGSLTGQGQVIGEQTVLDDKGNPKGTHGFVWDNGRLTDLGALGVDSGGNSDSHPMGFNSKGQIVGYGTFYENGIKKGIRGFLWSNGLMHNLGSLGLAADGSENSAALAINDNGQVGLVQVTNWDLYSNLPAKPYGDAFVWNNGQLTRLPLSVTVNGATFTPSSKIWSNVDIAALPNMATDGAVFTPPSDVISTGGLVMGSVNATGGLPPRAAIWENGTIKVFVECSTNQTPSLYCITRSEPLSINSQGQVAGAIEEVGHGQWGFLWANGEFHLIQGEVSGIRIFPFDINAKGDVAGMTVVTENPSGSPRGVFVYSLTSGYKRLPMLGYCDFWGVNQNFYRDMNDLGEIVGSSTYKGGVYDQTSGSGCPRDMHAYIYKSEGSNRPSAITDLNTLIPPDSGWELTNARSINNAGQILVEGNKGYALLTPVSNSPKASCDANQDGKVDTRDLSILYAHRDNQSYDIDGNGVVNSLDLRKCVLQCSQAHCKH